MTGAVWRHYVYEHIRNDTGRVFYVGKGTVKPKYATQVCCRAYELTRRNPHWHHVAKKSGYTVCIVASCRTDADAQALERARIAAHGKANLVNMTDGGDGHAGLSPSQETRRKLAAHASRPRTAAWIDSIRIARKDGGNGGVVRAGDVLPALWRQNISRGKLGERNPMFGKPSARARVVVDAATGVQYRSVLDAAVASGFKMKTLYNMLSGHRVNRTAMRFV